jgi:hypothetical protein
MQAGARCDPADPLRQIIHQHAHPVRHGGAAHEHRVDRLAVLRVERLQERDKAPNLASAMNIGAFNLGNAVGAAVGGVIDAGLGYPAVPLAGAAPASAGLALVLWLRRGGRAQAANPAACG